MNDLTEFAEDLYEDHPEFEDMEQSEIYDIVSDIISNDQYYIDQLNSMDDMASDDNDIEYNRSLDAIDYDIDITARKITRIIGKLKKE